MSVRTELITRLKNLLLFFHIAELKTLCTSLNVPSSGLKANLIERIVSHFNGGVVSVPKVKTVHTKLDNAIAQVISPKALMLQGIYKCDLQTRLFFKGLIGKHFHFTVYGHDWVKQRWAENNPPTYLEFAQFWQQEYQARKAGKISTPKREWAYINFLQMGGASC